MPTNYDQIDAVWLWNGDYDVGLDGDIADTYTDQIQSLNQEIMNVCASELQDWAEYQGLGATLSDFTGNANTADTAAQIQARIIDSLVNFNLVKASDVTVTIVPVGVYQLFVIIRVLAQATPNNSLENNVVVTNLVYDTQQGNIYFVDLSGFVVG